MRRARRHIRGNPKRDTSRDTVQIGYETCLIRVEVLILRMIVGLKLGSCIVGYLRQLKLRLQSSLHALLSHLTVRLVWHGDLEQLAVSQLSLDPWVLGSKWGGRGGKG